MASIKTYKRKDGGTTYTVAFVVGGGAAYPGCEWGTDSFTTDWEALQFKAWVERDGGNWPTCPTTGRRWVKGKGYVEPEPERPARPVLFAEVAEAYFDYERRVVVDQLKKKKVSTWDRDRSIYRNHLVAFFGDKPFTAIDPDLIAEWRETQLAPAKGKPAAAKSFANRHSVLFCIMEHGRLRMKPRLRADNPCEATEMPARVDNRQLMFFTHAEWNLFRSCLRSDIHLLADIKLATGMRWGEVAALRVGNCSIETDDDSEPFVKLYIERAWAERGESDDSPILWEQGENAMWKLDPPKGNKYRFVNVHGAEGVALMRAIAGRHGDEYVFVTAHGNPWRYDDFHSDRWAPALRLAEEHGLRKRLTPHMLRHTCVVWSVAQGVPIERVSYNLGHASVAYTWDTYGGLLNTTDPQVAKVMAAEMVRAKSAILPLKLTQAEIDARKVRTRNRGERGSKRHLRIAG